MTDIRNCAFLLNAIEHSERRTLFRHHDFIHGNVNRSMADILSDTLLLNTRPQKELHSLFFLLVGRRGESIFHYNNPENFRLEHSILHCNSHLILIKTRFYSWENEYDNGWHTALWISLKRNITLWTVFCELVSCRMESIHRL
jgi:hypothetical protein